PGQPAPVVRGHALRPKAGSSLGLPGCSSSDRPNDQRNHRQDDQSANDWNHGKATGNFIQFPISSQPSILSVSASANFSRERGTLSEKTSQEPVAQYRPQRKAQQPRS